MRGSCKSCSSSLFFLSFTSVAMKSKTKASETFCAFSLSTPSCAFSLSVGFKSLPTRCRSSMNFKKSPPIKPANHACASLRCISSSTSRRNAVYINLELCQRHCRSRASARSVFNTPSARLPVASCSCTRFASATPFFFASSGCKRRYTASRFACRSAAILALTGSMRSVNCSPLV